MKRMLKWLGAAIGGCLAILLVVGSIDAGAAAQTAPPPPEKTAAEVNGHPQDVSLPDTKRIDFVSKVNGRPYSIEVDLPDRPAPADGYPVIYVFDGDLFFLSFAEAVRINAPQAIIVGLGYPHDPAWVAHIAGPQAAMVSKLSPARAFLAMTQRARFYDLTPPTSDAGVKMTNSNSGRSLTKDDVGGGDDFLKTIETEVKPRVYALAKVNKDDQVLFGASLGGLAVLEALFTEPQAFHTFVASSPSIWWDDRSVLAKEAGFTAQVKEGKVTPRVLITVGGEEQSVPKSLPSGSARDASATIARSNRMVDNACELAGRLQALHGAKGYEVADCAVFKGLDHGQAQWAAIGHTMSFAFPH